MYSLTQLFVPAMNTQLANILNMEAFQSWTAIPIQNVRTFTAFLITAGSFTATRYMENERQRLVAAVQQARVEALEQQEVMRKDLLRHIVRAQEEERARIARELHDEMAQTLTAFSLDLATLQQSVGSKSKSGQLITRLQDLGKQMSNGIQRLVYDLRPAHLDDFGLVSALKFLADYESPRLNLKVDLRFDGEICRLDPLVETVIYRIAQEALTNAARHAQAEAVCVCLSFHPDQICLKIIDQGVGFDPEQQFIPPSGWGLAGMRERAESVGGNLQIQSKPGEGTTIVIVIPHGMTRE
jgi:two-component system sensor histidine kinase UhpB